MAEQKLVNLSEELASRDLDTIHKEMEDEEFRHTVEGGLAGNIRVEVPKLSSKSTLYGEPYNPPTQQSMSFEIQNCYANEI